MSEFKPQFLPLFPVKNYCDGATSTSLDVRFTPRCDSACSFCIAAEDMRDNARSYDEDAIIASLAKVDHTVLSIIGGEPLLFLKRLNSLIERVRGEYPRITEFHVTTALPYTVKAQPELFASLMAHLTSLNVSIQHYDTVQNNLVLNSKKSFDRLALLEVLMTNETWAHKTRVHLNLSRDGINNGYELNKALAKLKEMGVRKVKINELMNAPDQYISFEEITGETLLSPYANGCSTELNYFDGLEIVLKRSCFVVEESLSATAQDARKMMWKKEMGFLDKRQDRARVVYEDGTLTDSWLGEAI